MTRCAFHDTPLTQDLAGVPHCVTCRRNAEKADVERLHGSQAMVSRRLPPPATAEHETGRTS